MFGKIFFFIFLFMWVRWTIPRFRYDQLMRLGWQILMPIAIVNVLLTAAAITLFGN
jgi:NADH-quinone oxidoreductase subunit H